MASFKGGIDQLEENRNIEVLKEDDISDVSPEEAKRIMWKIDRRLITVTGLCY
jgi:hypothetical protein